jgi:hypothetical protein
MQMTREPCHHALGATHHQRWNDVQDAHQTRLSPSFVLATASEASLSDFEMP